MDNIEAKALALLNASEKKMGLYKTKKPEYDMPAFVALYLAIEQHEAFRQEVSDALLEYYGGYHNASGESLERFIIPKPKPDPLVEVLHEVDTGPEWDSSEDYCNKIRAALEARGLEIREKQHDI